jgi:hypothetical protein
MLSDTWMNLETVPLVRAAWDACVIFFYEALFITRVTTVLFYITPAQQRPSIFHPNYTLDACVIWEK